MNYIDWWNIGEFDLKCIFFGHFSIAWNFEIFKGLKFEIFFKGLLLLKKSSLKIKKPNLNFGLKTFLFKS